MSNHPPHLVLELDKSEADWLFSLLVKAERAADANFRDICSMSSKDPRAQNRVLLQMAATVDHQISESLLETMENQDGTLDRNDPRLLKTNT